MKRLFGLVFIVLCGLQPVLWSQTERILNYDTEIEVFKDRSIIVKEDIQVYVMGDVIKRGITRFLPGERSLNNRNTSMSYKILSVEKNGQPEPYLNESSRGGRMLYLGDRDVFLTPGIYNYSITYKVPGQIGFFDDYDEIYWNAIGNEVQFDVDHASCRVVLPKDAAVIQESAYMGLAGRQEKDYSLKIDNGVLIYQTTRALGPGEGFTVAVGFEKGVISAPGFFDRLGAFLVILLGAIFLLPYYVYTWWRHGQDPPTPASYPLWDVPDGLSAGSINYIQKGHYQKKSLTAAVIDLAIKGYLKIEEVEEKGFFKKNKHYQLIKIKDSSTDLPPEEKGLFDRLFMTTDIVRIDGTYDSSIESSYGTHQASLSGQHKAFINEGNNFKLLITPILITIAVIVIAGLLISKSTYGAALNIGAIATFVPAAVLAILIYGYLIRKPSTAKLELRSRIKGFKMYLEMTEKDRLNLLNPPEMTPEHFETVLPYAFALGVEHKWSETFKDILEKAQYRPNWNNSTNMMYFSSHFGRDFTRDIAGAATKPTQSGSGSGGGGFSGGGGGGGGVGGW